MTTFDFEAWKMKRKWTTIIMYCQFSALGMEHALTYATLYPYLELVFKTKHVVFFYSAISAVYLVSQIVMSLIFGRLFDDHRNLRFMLVFGDSLVIIGNILYSIPLSPLMLFAGRLLSGGGGCLEAIMVSELARSYRHEELTTTFSRLAMFYSSGYVIGPAISTLFVKADFMFLGIHIGYENGSGLVLTAVFIIMLVLAVLFTSNLSKEYDLKASTMNDDKTSCDQGLITEEKELEEKEENNPPISVIDTFVALIRKKDIVVLFVLTLFFRYCLQSFNAWVPMICLKLLKWSTFEISMVFLVNGIVCGVILLFLSLKPPGEKMMFNLGMYSFFCVACICAIMFVFTMQVQVKVLDLILWFIYTICFSLAIVLDSVFLQCTMAKVVRSEIQAFAESVRLSFYRIGSLLAFVSAASAFLYLKAVTIGYVVGTILFFILMMWRRESLSNPSVLV